MLFRSIVQQRRTIGSCPLAIVIPNGASSGPEHTPNQLQVCRAHRNKSVSILSIEDTGRESVAERDARQLGYDAPNNIGQLSIRRQMELRIVGKPSIYIGNIFGLNAWW